MQEADYFRITIIQLFIKWYPYSKQILTEHYYVSRPVIGCGQKHKESNYPSFRMINIVGKTGMHYRHNIMKDVPHSPPCKKNAETRVTAFLILPGHDNQCSQLQATEMTLADFSRKEFILKTLHNLQQHLKVLRGYEARDNGQIHAPELLVKGHHCGCHGTLV